VKNPLIKLRCVKKSAKTIIVRCYKIACDKCEMWQIPETNSCFLIFFPFLSKIYYRPDARDAMRLRVYKQSGVSILRVFVLWKFVYHHHILADPAA
jgi:hypothetical protein